MRLPLALVAGGLLLLEGCATTPSPDEIALRKQVAELENQVSQLHAQVSQQQGYMASITGAPANYQAPAQSGANPAWQGAPTAPTCCITAPPAAASGAGPYVNVRPKPVDLPAPAPTITSVMRTYAVYLGFTDIGALQRVDAFLDAHGITDRKDSTEDGHLAIYFGVYAEKRAAENRRQQIVDETGLQPQIATIGG